MTNQFVFKLPVFFFFFRGQTLFFFLHVGQTFQKKKKKNGVSFEQAIDQEDLPQKENITQRILYI